MRANLHRFAIDKTLMLLDLDEKLGTANLYRDLKSIVNNVFFVHDF